MTPETVLKLAAQVGNGIISGDNAFQQVVEDAVASLGRRKAFLILKLAEMEGV